MIRRILAMITLCLMITLLNAPAVMAEGQSVYDEAGLFNQEEIRSLEANIQGFKEASGMDMAIATTEHTSGISASEYAEELYINHNLGTGSTYDGVLFLIDMDNRELCVKPSGAMTRYLTDERIESMMDEVYKGAQDEDFAASAHSFITETLSFYKNGIESGQYNYDSDTGEVSRHKSIRWYEALIALLVSLFSAAVPCLNIKREYAMEQQRNQSGNYLMAYKGVSQFAYGSQADDLLDKHVTQRMIAVPPPSSGGRSRGGGSSAGRSTVHTNSGRTFGGGSRKF